MNRESLIMAATIGLVLQLIMVVLGHYNPTIREKGFAIGGMVISLIAGAIYVRLAGGDWMTACAGGAIAGGVCALLGIAVSVPLNATPPMILVVGTIASTVTGAIGAALGKLIG